MGDIRDDPDLVILSNTAGTEVGTTSDPLKVQVDTTAPVTVTDAQASSATTVRHASISTTVTTISADNTERRGLIIFNEGSKEAFIKFGATATVTDYAFQVTFNGGYWEMPSPIYTGIVTAVTAASTTILQVTESEV